MAEAALAPQASPRDDISLQYSVTPASPPDGMLFDSPWTTAASNYAGLRQAAFLESAGTAQATDSTRTTSSRPFAAAASELRSLLKSIESDGDALAALSA